MITSEPFVKAYTCENYERVVRPAVNIREGKTEFFVEVDLPGVKKHQIEITIEKSVLSLSATRAYECKENESLFHEESVNTTYRREIILGSDIVTDQIQARFENGVLSLTLKKVEKAVPKKIEIQ